MNATQTLVLALVALAASLSTAGSATAICVDVQGTPCVVGVTNRCENAPPGDPNGQTAILLRNDEAACIRWTDVGIQSQPEAPLPGFCVDATGVTCIVGVTGTCQYGTGDELQVGLIVHGGETVCVRE